MTWDDELEQLTTSTLDRLGDHALSSAVDRALQVALEGAWPVDPALVEEFGVTDADGRELLPMSAFYDALKIELRRLLTVQ